MRHSFFLRRSHSWFFVVVLSLWGAGCAGSREREVSREPDPDRPVEEQVDWASLEDFDPSPYPEEAPVTQVNVEHDVPSKLMEGRANAGISRTVDGYRIQIFQTQDKRTADREIEQVTDWWRSEKAVSASDLFKSRQPPVYIFYRQPYYRIRLGDFQTREQAQKMLRALQERYPAAAIVPDTVTIEQ